MRCEKIKVILYCRPKMLYDVIKDMVERQPDMEVVGEVFDPIEFVVSRQDKGGGCGHRHVARFGAGAKNMSSFAGGASTVKNRDAIGKR